VLEEMTQETPKEGSMQQTMA
jgi:hypothetical protein